MPVLPRRWASLVVAGLLLTGTARADDAEARRTQLYREGTDLADSGQWTEAAAKFEQVVAIRSAPRALIALGVAEEHLGRLVRAKKTFTSAADDAHADGLAGDERAARDALAEVAPRIPRLQVVPPAGALIASLAIDGADATVTSGVMDIDPGDHTVTAFAADGRKFEATVRCLEQSTCPVTVVFPALPLPLTVAPRPGAPAPPRRSGPSVGVIIVGGIGIAATGTALALWASGKQQENSVKAKCPNGGTSGCDPSLQPAADASREKLLSGNALFGVGLATIAVSGVWWWLSSRRDDAPAPPSAIGISPLPGGGYVGVRGAL